MMKYSTFVPSSRLQPLVECYWIVEGADLAEQKIIPDGFNEMIFHFGDPYQVVTQAGSQEQALSIAAGQIQNPIFLKPAGVSGVFGVKFKPAGMWRFVRCDMTELSNQTLSLNDVVNEKTEFISEQLKNTIDHAGRIKIVERFLIERINATPYCPTIVDEIVNQIFKNNGRINIQKLATENKVSVRKIERLFSQQIGVAPKLYSRLIRFNYVFRLLQQENFSKTEITYLSGYFDQAHFNKEFKEFTGENPESWMRQNHRFANFFLSL